MAVPYKLNYFEIESGLGTSSTFLHKGDFTANRIIKIGGTSNDILLGDGSVGSLSGKQNTITLTTIGTSGASTLIGATLNIPNYSPDLTGYVTLGTAQTITGTKTFDNNTLKLIGIGTTRPTIITNAGGLSKGSLIENFFGFNSNNDIYFSKSQNSQGIFSFNNTNLRTYTFQDLSGTVAFTSDIPSLAGYVPTSRELTINGTTYDLSADRSWSVGTVTSVGLTMPTAFSVANSPVTSTGTLAVTANGLASQYIRGDGQLADFPTGGGGGGSSVSYYLNGSVNQGTFVGNTYYEMNKVPIFGAGTDFSIGADGYIAQFITDANDPNSLLIPAGNWNFETYFSASSGGGTPSFYVELYKYSGTTFTLIASNSAVPELISLGTSINPYFSALAVPETVLLATDRLAIRIYVTHSGRTITLHTENSHLCQIITTFTTGLQSLNGLTKQTQYFAVGTSGSNFNISSSVDTHTFNLPNASSINRGALTSADWITFNGKQNAITLTTTGTSGAATLVGSTLNIPIYSQDLSGFVTLNTAQTITAAKTFSTSGSSDTLTINHSSGSGIGLSITKGGNGEGIYVNKTSGTGNAVTIIGTLNATTIVKNGGTSSQFLKADGSVDSNTYALASALSDYVTLGTTQTITGLKTFSLDTVVNGVEIGRGGGNIATNTRIGDNSLLSNTTGTDNSAFGTSSLSSNTIGFSNTGIGSLSLSSNTTGSENTAIGIVSLGDNTTGDFNTAIGRVALGSNISGSYNVGIGADAGYVTSLDDPNSTSSNSIFLGSFTKTLANNQTNQIVIGHSAIGLGSNTTVLGNSSTTFGRWWGNLLIGDSTNSGQPLQVTGNMKLTGTLTNGTYTYTLPSATGTLALTSNLSAYLPLAGGTLTGAFRRNKCYILKRFNE
jgi:hypothetical protein